MWLFLPRWTRVPDLNIRQRVRQFDRAALDASLRDPALLYSLYSNHSFGDAAPAGHFLIPATGSGLLGPQHGIRDGNLTATAA